MAGPVRDVIFQDSPGRWQLSTAPPDADLAPAVKELWEVRGELAAFREKVLPNGCVEVMVNLGPTHTLFTAAGESRWDHSWYSGVQEKSLFIESLHGTHLVAARLHPLGARALFGVSAAENANRVIDLRVLAGAGADRLRADLVTGPDAAARFARHEQFLRDRPPAEPVPSFVSEAARRIEAAHGRVRVSSLHRDLGVSRKHLAVSFARDVGIPAKAYAQIHRFVWTVAAIQASTSIDWSSLADEAGYADQSHLVRDFQRVAGANPTVFLRQQTPDGSALLVDEPW
jgi:AraC-like DNA-binding protein